MARRLPFRDGEWIHRESPLAFRFEGRSHTGVEGDTITSALLASGLTTLGRSFKYHRRRGVLSAANHDINTLVTDGADPHLRADVTPLRDGMDLRAVNTRGGLERDRTALLDHLGRFLPVGFYYKAFHTPRALFPFWERLIRHLAGLGEVDTAAAPSRWPRDTDHCDLLVVGAGASGLAAAARAAEGGARVVVVDENPQPGAGLVDAALGDPAAARQRENLLQRLRSSGADLRCATFAAGYYADHWVPLAGPAGITRMRARAVLVATGVFEQPTVFRNNDRPGVMNASAALRLAARYSVAATEAPTIVTANADGYRVAAALAAAGIEVRGIADPGDPAERGKAVAAAEAAGIPVHANTRPVAATGRREVAGLTVDSADGGQRTLACDGILMSTGWAPAAALLYQAGAQMRYIEPPGQFLPVDLPAGIFAAGRVNGVFDPARKEADGEAAADEALAHLGLGPPEPRARPARSGAAESHPWPVFPHPRGRDFIDFDEDVQVKDLKGAVAEGFDNIELMKRFTTVGMGPSQGKHSNMTAVRLLARERGQAIEATGTTTARPLFHPVPMGMLAGTRRRPQRRSPVHGRHAAAGAHFMPSGAWLRPAWYGHDPAAAVAAEYRAVREAAGLMDVSTLGKMEVFGPDAATLLERFCINGFARLKVGRSRYAVMVDEAGVIRDDGVAARLGREHFYLTTTSGGADASYRELLRSALELGLDATVINRTGQVAALNLAGPQATAVLAGVTAEAGAIEALPAGGVGSFDIAGTRARVLRTGFTGHEAFEIHLPADRGRHLWDSLTTLGAAHGLRPFGVEAQRLLRLEMGHLILGQDTDATATPLEAGLERLIRWDKGDFIGRRSLEILARRGPRERLTGLRLDPEQGSAGLEPGCLVLAGEAIAGRLTSIGESPALGTIGLASVPAERATPGQPLTLKAVDGRRCRATTCATPFSNAEETA